MERDCPVDGKHSPYQGSDKSSLQAMLVLLVKPILIASFNRGRDKFLDEHPLCVMLVSSNCCSLDSLFVEYLNIPNSRLFSFFGCIIGRLFQNAVFHSSFVL